MTDDQLREAAARALGWRKTAYGSWDAPSDLGPRVTVGNSPPLDWTTAGALLESFYSGKSAHCLTSLELSEYGIEVFDYRTLVDGEPLYACWPTITLRNVIEACVRALDTVK